MNRRNFITTTGTVVAGSVLLDPISEAFAGAGAGIFSLASAEISSDEGAVSGGTKFGGMIRGGVEMSHFRIGIEYNIVPTTKFAGFDNNGDPASLTSKNGYLGIKLGVCIGGGPR